MGHAARFGEALLEGCLLAGIVVAGQGATSVADEIPGIPAGTALGEVTNGALLLGESQGAVGPLVNPMGLAGAGLEHGDKLSLSAMKKPSWP